jgi:hypothetical protein
MITLASSVAAVKSVATGTYDIIFHPSLLSSRAADINVVRRYYDTWATGQTRHATTVKLGYVATVSDRSSPHQLKLFGRLVGAK